MIQIENVVTDRGSKYTVSGTMVSDWDGVEAFVNVLKKKKKFSKATHNTWAVILSNGEQVKNDDGESGAGMLILRMLEREGVFGEVVVVTRWYGGVHLGGDRFRHVQTCVRAYLEARN
jgi:putative IMPACT (imprinted ancient) family translation regulator